MAQQLTFSSTTAPKTAVEKKQNNRLSTPERFFKILLITSLFFKFKKCDDPNETDLMEFNAKYRIVTRVDSLWIPSVLSGLLWRKLDTAELERKVTSGEVTISQAVHTIYSQVPKIGYYKGMMADIERVLADVIKVR